MKFVVNGRPVDVTADPEDTALDVIRDGLGLTGTKLGCGAGTCGACTVLADAVPVCACLLPAAHLHGRAITTIEGLGAGDHPVQRAFMYEDALQCGYCTPGFVVQAVAFFDAWRAARGRTLPEDDAIAAACAGHLCRCGAYPHIRRAIARACAGDYDAMPSGDPPRHDARLKVTGEARYTVDIRLTGQLEGRVCRSPVAHADLIALDLGPAAASEGVVSVVDLTAGARRVRYAGQELAAVAALNRHQAARGVEAVRLNLVPHPPALGLAASRPDAPRVYESVFEPKVSEAELPVPPSLWRDNVRGPTFLMSHRGLKARRLVREAAEAGGADLDAGLWRSSAQSHTPLEPHACVAHWPAADRIEVHLSTQACADLAIDIAERWRLPRDHVRVRCEFVGGAFGAKADLTMEAVAAIELSRAAGRPVRVALPNDEELTAGGYRPAVALDLSLHMTGGGAIGAVSLVARTDGGVAIGSTVAAVARFPYPRVPKWLSDYDVVSHAPPARPFRGPGGPAAFWALEQTLDAAARRRGLDPVAVRRLNDADPNTAALLDWVEALPVWRTRQALPREGRFVQGVGLALGTWTAFVHNDTAVEVSAGRHGLVVSSACQDMGNGSRTVLADVVAGVFGVEASLVDVRIGDSRLPRGTMSSGSRTTATVVPAALAAAMAVREAMAEAASARRGLRGRAPHDAAGLHLPGGIVGWRALMAESDAVSRTMKRPRDPGGYVLPFALDGFLLSPARPVAAHVCRVTVDRDTGRIAVPHVWSGFAIGRVRVPALARSQAVGGAVQGVSYALYEERRLDPVTGRTLTQSLDDHRLAGIADAPDVDVYFVPGEFRALAGGGAGLGELSTLAVAAAVGNAVHDATGWRPTALPLRIESVLGALRPSAAGGR